MVGSPVFLLSPWQVWESLAARSRRHRRSRAPLPLRDPRVGQPPRPAARARRRLYAHERSQGKKGGIGDSRVRSSQRDIDFAGTGVVLCLVAAATRRARARSPESYEHVRHHSMKQA
jgi:hypothetical protein